MNREEIILTVKEIKELLYHVYFDPLDEDNYNPKYLVIERNPFHTDKQTLITKENIVVKNQQDNSLLKGELHSTWNNKVAFLKIEDHIYHI